MFKKEVVLSVTTIGLSENLTEIHCTGYLKKDGAKRVCLSFEIDDETMKSFDIKVGGKVKITIEMKDKESQ